MMAEAESLFWRLEKSPMTIDQITAWSGWSYPQARKRIKVAREYICEDLVAVIPRAIAAHGYTYQVFDGNNIDGSAVQTSTGVAIDDSMTRLKTIHRVSEIGLKVLDGRTRHAKAAKIMEFRVRQAIEELALLEDAVV